MPTTFERTRIASAILTAVAMLSTPAFAADEAPDTTLSLKLPCLKTEELQYAWPGSSWATSRWATCRPTRISTSA